MTSEGLNGVKPGDHLVLVTGNRYRGDEPVTVSRVGRQYLYVSLHGVERRERYDRKTGVEVDQRGIRSRLVTPQQYEESKQRDALFHALMDAGIEVRQILRPKLSTDNLRALLAIVQDDDTVDRDTKK